MNERKPEEQGVEFEIVEIPRYPRTWCMEMVFGSGLNAEDPNHEEVYEWLKYMGSESDR